MQTTGPVIGEIGNPLIDALMRSGAVVIGLILLERSLEVRPVKEEKMISAFALQSSV